MKKKVKYLIAIAICLFGFHITNVYAGNATGGVTSNGEEDCSIKYNGKDGNGNTVNGICHHNYGIEINYNGKKYEGYCGDLNKHLSGGQSPYTCEEVADATLAYILGSNYSRSEKTAALRGYTSGISNNNANAGQLLTDAQNGVGLSIDKVSENGNIVTYQVSTTLNASDISFTCGAGCSNISYSGSTLTLTVTQGACSYSFTVTYPGTVSTGRVLRCHSQELQDVYILDISDTTSSGATTSGGRTTQTFSGSLENTGSAYYKQYCDRDNKCNEKTDIQIPQFCDDPNDETITITAPKNIKYCILNGQDDAGNTYKMDDGQIKKDNPYCAVYCKEDYEMTMPGAQYTDSGRYFKLKNTIVKATRTCYTTNPSGDHEKTNIDIKKFIADVKAAQEAIISAKNEYEYAKAFNDARLEDPEVTCPQMVNGVQTYIKLKRYTKEFDYKVYSLGGYNAQTGEYTTIKESTEHANLSWGDCNNKPAPDVLDPGTALSNLNAVVNLLKEKIDHMEDCYNWKNNLCMNTEVQFDYNEQYNTDINYTLVSGGGTFSSDDATYSTTETIDNNYSANGGGALNNYRYVNCTESSCNRSNVAERISTLVQKLYHSKIEVSGTAEYANVQEFQTNYPHGTIDTVADQSALRYNYSYLGAVFPVALNTSTGVYKWTLNFSKLGQYNDDACRNGRLDDVIRAQGKSVGAGLEYVCVYVVDCDDCDYECVGEGCLIPDDKCPECDVYCTNCIFDGDGFTFNYRMIGWEVNPAERELGSNLTSDKGQKAIKEIESDGEDIYIEAEYTYIMNANNMKAIRDYNKQMKNYVPEDLDFHDVGKFKNVYGTSTFLDNGEKNGFFKEIKRNKNWEQWPDISKNMGPAWK